MRVWTFLVVAYGRWSPKRVALMGGLFREEGPIPPINVFNFCVTIIYTQFHVVSVSHTLVEEFRAELFKAGLR